MSGWVGATAAALNPLIEALTADVMTSDTLHVDDTPVPAVSAKIDTGEVAVEYDVLADLVRADWRRVD